MSLSIDLNDEIEEHFQRVKRLADEADDEMSEDTLASRAQAMKVYIVMLQNLLSMKEKAYNLLRIGAIEQALMETAKEYFDDYQTEEFMKNLGERLSKVPE